MCYALRVITSPPLTVAETAVLLQVSEGRVRQLLKDARLVDAGVVGRSHMIARASVHRLAAERAAKPPRAGRPRIATRTAATAAPTPPNDGAKNVH